MNGYAVELTGGADQELDRLPTNVIRRIASAIDRLEVNPRPRGARKLAGSRSSYRIRVGQYRVIYAIDDDTRIVYVTRVRHRKDAYQ